MINKLLENTTITKTTFGNTDISLSDSTKVYLDSAPFKLKKTQMDYIKSDDTIEIYKNPLQDIITECKTLITQVKDNIQIYITGHGLYPTGKTFIPESIITSLKIECNTAITTLSQFNDHTDRMSGVKTASGVESAKINSDNPYIPDLNSALATGRQLLQVIYKADFVKAVKFNDIVYAGEPGDTYDQIIANNDQIPMYSYIDGDIVIAANNPDVIKGYVNYTTNPSGDFVTENPINSTDNTTMLGSFGSLYINDDNKITDKKEMIKSDFDSLKSIISIDTTNIENIDENNVVSVYTNISENTNLQEIIPKLKSEIKDLSDTLTAQMNSDIIFFNNSKKLLKKVTDANKESNLGSTHDLLFDKIGSTEFKNLTNGKSA